MRWGTLIKQTVSKVCTFLIVTNVFNLVTFVCYGFGLCEGPNSGFTHGKMPRTLQQCLALPCWHVMCPKIFHHKHARYRLMQCCVRDDSTFQCEHAIFDPLLHKTENPWAIKSNFSTIDYLSEIPRFNNFGFYSSARWRLAHMWKYLGLFYFLPQPQVKGWTLNQFSRVMPQTTQFGAIRCLVGFIFLPKEFEGK